MNIKKFIEILKVEFKNINGGNEIGFLGIIGSKNIVRDVDIIFLPGNVENKIDLIKKYFELVKNVKKRLKKEKSDLIPFSWLNYQSEVEYISGKKDNEVMMHCLFFIANPYFEEVKEHYAYEPKYKEFEKFISKAEIVAGNIELAKKNKISVSDHEYEYNLITNLVELFANYPKELREKKIEVFKDYIKKNSKDEDLLDLIDKIKEISGEF